MSRSRARFLVCLGIMLAGLATASAGPREERGRSDFDRTHVFTAASVWEVPVGKGRRFFNNAPGFVNTILGGWTINTIYTRMSGEPFAVRSGAFTSNGSHEGRAGVQAPVTAQLQE